jgi:hypothetical protein
MQIGQSVCTDLILTYVVKSGDRRSKTEFSAFQKGILVFPNPKKIGRLYIRSTNDVSKINRYLFHGQTETRKYTVALLPIF